MNYDLINNKIHDIYNWYVYTCNYICDTLIKIVNDKILNTNTNKHIHYLKYLKRVKNRNILYQKRRMRGLI